MIKRSTSNSIAAALLIASWLSPAMGQSVPADSSGRLHSSVGAAVSATPSNRVPFWLRTNRFGKNPNPGVTGIIDASLYRSYTDQNKLVDWGFGVDGQVNLSSDTKAILSEAYLKGRVGIFQAKIGRSKDIMGLVDTTLSSGAFAISGNALGIPKLEVSIPQYWSIPFIGDWIAVKGNFAVGSVGKTTLTSRFHENAAKVNTFYHQKSLYARLGKSTSKLKAYAGFNHQVFWGNECDYLGDDFKLSGISTFLYVVAGQAYGDGNGNGVPRSKIGNHIGSIDQMISYEFKNLDVQLYHQFFYDIGGLYHLSNVKDGIWGISLQPKHQSSSAFTIRRINFEFLNAKSQGGEIDARKSPSGDEDYYNNYIYYRGWTYSGENLGNGFFTSRKYAKADLPTNPNDYFINNRIRYFHAAVLGQSNKWTVQAKMSYSFNYGTYGTSPWGHSLGSKRFPQPGPYFEETSQFSGLLEVGRFLNRSFEISLALAMDRGEILPNVFGSQLRLVKRF